MTHQYPPIMLVNDKDKPIGSAPLEEVHKKGLMHRIVVVNVVNESKQILLQQRADWVLTHPGLWDASAAGHVDEGESYEQAALRELKEELGLENYKLNELGKVISNTKYNDRLLNRFKMVYQVEIPDDTAISFDAHELLDIKWFSKSELKQFIKDDPEALVPDFIELLQKYYL